MKQNYVYDEAENAPWAELPDDWKCPLCGASKSDFVPEESSAPAVNAVPGPHEEMELKPLTALETSALCTNLAKGCEKQYKPEQADAFRKLAAWFKTQKSSINQSRQTLSESWQPGLRRKAAVVPARLLNY